MSEIVPPDTSVAKRFVQSILCNVEILIERPPDVSFKFEPSTVLASEKILRNWTTSVVKFYRTRLRNIIEINCGEKDFHEKLSDGIAELMGVENLQDKWEDGGQGSQKCFICRLDDLHQL